jgi:methylamine dehydrogenase light chain
MSWLSHLDRWTERTTRGVARRTSRRSFLTRLGTLIVGGSALPLLPIARIRSADAADLPPEDPGDPGTCEYWRHCAIDGYLCSCCGGSQNTCPPGTEASPVTWIGTCRNPADDRDYIISYNDCCGKSSCARCGCNRNEGDEPIYRPSKANDINWCLGTKSLVYNCSTAVVLGVAPK